MARDSIISYGDTPIDRAGLAESLTSSTANVVKQKAGPDVEATNKVYNAVNVLAQKFDSNARLNLAKAKEMVNAVVRLRKEMMTDSKREKRERGLTFRTMKEQGMTSKTLAKTMSKFTSESRKKSTLWFGISKLHSVAEKQYM